MALVTVSLTSSRPPLGNVWLAVILMVTVSSEGEYATAKPTFLQLRGLLLGGLGTILQAVITGIAGAGADRAAEFEGKALQRRVCPPACLSCWSCGERAVGRR